MTIACGGLVGTGRSLQNGLTSLHCTMNRWRWLKRKCSSTIAFLPCSLVLLVIQSQYNSTSYNSIKINLGLFDHLVRGALFTSHDSHISLTLFILCLGTSFYISPISNHFSGQRYKDDKKRFHYYHRHNLWASSHEQKKSQVNTKGGGDAKAKGGAQKQLSNNYYHLWRLTVRVTKTFTRHFCAGEVLALLDEFSHKQWISGQT